MSGSSNFFSELKRRHVYRVAVAYFVVGWLLIQFATSVFPTLSVPAWATTLVVLLIAIGFPIALIFAWAFELTPEGIRRTEPATSPEARPAEVTQRVGRQLNTIIIGVMALVILLLLGDRFLVHRSSIEPAPGAATMAGPPGAGTPAKSIAVMPFANTSGDPGNEYFSDGMSEELINALGRLRDLTVIGRSSSFQFKGKGEDAKTIGAKLGVAYLLEGSVRKAEDKVRIAVELVNAGSGADVWSETYDRDLKDIFAVQTDIATQVAGKLKSTLLAGTDSGAPRELKPDAPPSGNVAAYSALLQGNFYLDRRSDADLVRAIDFYGQAIQLDPRYALAYARLAFARSDRDGSFTVTTGDARIALEAELKKALATALELDPESADAHIAQGYAMELFDLNVPGAIAEYQLAQKLAPQNPLAELRLAITQGYAGQFDAAVAGLRHMLTLDPLSARGHYYLGITLTRLGRYAEAEAAIRKAIELQPQAGAQHQILAINQVADGRSAEAVATAQAETDPFWRTYALAAAHSAHGDQAEADAALQKLIAENADDSGFQIAQIYALRKQPDEAFKWLAHAFESHDGGVQQMRLSPFLAAYEKDPRFEVMARRAHVWTDAGTATGASRNQP